LLAPSTFGTLVALGAPAVPCAGLPAPSTFGFTY